MKSGREEFGHEGNSPKQGLTSAKDLSIYRRLDQGFPTGVHV